MSGDSTTGDNGADRMSFRTILVLAAILLTAFVLRLHRVGDMPAGLFCDEAALGYNAYTIGQTGRDENGELLPLYVRSFVGHKNPVFIYAAIVPIKLFGLNEASVRMTSVVFGTLTILGAFLLAREMWGRQAGLASAFFLSITPWHFHFSRIAFELISFPCLFIFALYFLVRAVRKGGSNWLWGGVLLGLTLYTYALSSVFLALFLPFFVLVYFRRIARPERRRGALLAAAVFAVLAARVAYVKLASPSDMEYFGKNTWIFREVPLSRRLSFLGEAYMSFYSFDFLFRSGDPIPRHSVSGDGELHLSFLPLMIVGLAYLLIRPRRENLLLLWWCVTFPAGAVLMNEIPSATRSIIGSPLGALLAGIGLSRMLSAISILRERRLRQALSGATVALVAAACASETRSFLSLYHGGYREESARAFQAGYGEIISYFEEVSAEFPYIYQTALDVNSPYIFERFYTRRLPPRGAPAHADRRYPEFALHEFLASRLNVPGRRMLYALRPEELVYLSEYDVKKAIRLPDGRKDFVIVEPRRERRFFDRWALLGPLRFDPDAGPEALPGSSRVEPHVKYPGVSGDVSWRPAPKISSPWHIPFSDIFSDPSSPRELRNVCARATTYFRTREDVDRPLVEVFGSEDTLLVSLNGEPVFGPARVKDRRLQGIPVVLAEGWNELSVTSCHEKRHWFLGARVSDGGREIEGLESRTGLDEAE